MGNGHINVLYRQAVYSEMHLEEQTHKEQQSSITRCFSSILFESATQPPETQLIACLNPDFPRTTRKSRPIQQYLQ